MLLDPTSVVLNSLPAAGVVAAIAAPPTPAVTPITLVAAAGDCDGLG